MTLKEKQDFMVQTYEEARRRGLARNQKEFAALLDLNQSTISSAINGVEKALTDRLVRRVKKWAEIAFHEEPQPQSSQQRPDIVIPAATADLYNNMSETIRLQAEIIARLQAGAGAAIATGAPKNFYLDPK